MSRLPKGTPKAKFFTVNINARLRPKLERMRVGSARSSLPNVIETLIELADENAPEWNLVPPVESGSPRMVTNATPH
jgi:hypothetical protein